MIGIAHDSASRSSAQIINPLGQGTAIGYRAWALRPSHSGLSVDCRLGALNSHAPEVCFCSAFDCLIADLKSETIEATASLAGSTAKAIPLWIRRRFG